VLALLLLIRLVPWARDRWGRPAAS
jgi:hypothetical protein